MGRNRNIDALSDEADEAMLTARQALDEARRMPGGDEKYESLKRASKLRLEADRMREEVNARARQKAEAADDE